MAFATAAALTAISTGVGSVTSFLTSKIEDISLSELITEFAKKAAQDEYENPDKTTSVASKIFQSISQINWSKTLIVSSIVLLVGIAAYVVLPIVGTAIGVAVTVQILSMIATAALVVGVAFPIISVLTLATTQSYYKAKESAAKSLAPKKFIKENAEYIKTQATNFANNVKNFYSEMTFAKERADIEKIQKSSKQLMEDLGAVERFQDSYNRNMQETPSLFKRVKTVFSLKLQKENKIKKYFLNLQALSDLQYELLTKWNELTQKTQIGEMYQYAKSIWNGGAKPRAEESREQNLKNIYEDVSTLTNTKRIQCAKNNPTVFADMLPALSALDAARSAILESMESNGVADQELISQAILRGKAQLKKIEDAFIQYAVEPSQLEQLAVKPQEDVQDRVEQTQDSNENTSAFAMLRSWVGF